MKNSLIIVFTLLLSVVNGQFNKGYTDGHKVGYCNASSQNGEMYCNYPYTNIIAPLPKIGESNSSYKDGYNRGIYDGQQVYKSSSNTQPEYQNKEPYKYEDPQQIDTGYLDILNKAPRRQVRRTESNKNFKLGKIPYILSIGGSVAIDGDYSPMLLGLETRLRLGSITSFGLHYESFLNASQDEIKIHSISSLFNLHLGGKSLFFIAGLGGSYTFTDIGNQFDVSFQLGVEYLIPKTPIGFEGYWRNTYFSSYGLGVKYIIRK